MWIGSRDENDRIIIQWKPVKEYRENGKLVAVDYEPNHAQKQLLVEIEKKKVSLKDFKVDIKAKTLIKK